MRFSLVGLLILTGGHLLGQSLFKNYKLKKDSLNNIQYKKLKSSGQFDTSSKKTGLWIEYELLIDTVNKTIPATVQGKDFSTTIEFPNPSILQKSEGQFLNGEMNGQWKWFQAIYDRNDSLIWEINKEIEFKEGNKNGMERNYSSGQVFYETSYLNDEQHGIQTMYYPPGVLYVKGVYKYGTAQYGTWYYEKGQIKKTQDYKKYPIVTVVEYYESGKVKSKYTLLGEDKKLDGKFKSYDENGKLTDQKKYSNGDELKK